MTPYAANNAGPLAILRDVHERGFRILQRGVVRPDALREIHLQAAEKSGEDDDQDGGEQHVAFGIVNFFREDGDAIEADEHQRGERSTGGDGADIKCGRIVNRMHREQPGEMLVQDDEAERFDQKHGGDQQHEAEQDFVGARGEFNSLHREDGDEADGDGGQDGEGDARRHALNGEHGVERVLDGLKEIFEKHGPADDESEVRIQFAADVGVHRTGGGIDAGHAAEADGGDGHRDHREQKSRDGVAVRKNLAFTEERDGGDGRSENDAVVDQVPEAQRALEMRFPGCCGLRCACGCFHPYLAVPRVSKETFATATRMRPRRNCSLTKS